MLSSLGIAGLVAVAIGLFTAAVVISQRRENIETTAEFAKYKVDVGNEIVAAQSVGDIAKRDAAKANEATEALKSKNLELEKAFAPRVLEQAVTAQALKPFAGQRVSVVSLPDAEPRRAAGQIRFMLAQAGWNVVHDIPPMDFAYFDGVFIHGDTAGAGETKAKTRSAIDALVSVLNGAGVDTKSGYPQSNDTIFVVVGPKPLPESMQMKPEDVPADGNGNRMYGNIME